MLPAPGKYQASFFADLLDIKPSAQYIPPLLEMFADKNLVPNTAQEFGPLLTSPQIRLILSSPDNEWILLFETQRINVVKNATQPLGTNLGTPEQFAADAIDFFNRIVLRFPRKGNRLALVTEGLMAEMSGSKMEQIYAAFFVPFGLYDQKSTLTWNSTFLTKRTVELAGQTEALNILTSINRIQPEYPSKFLPEPTQSTSQDRIQLTFDINTLPENREFRFQMPHVHAFYPEVLRIRESLLSALGERVNA